jgi:hypothetical protein
LLSFELNYSGILPQIPKKSTVFCEFYAIFYKHLTNKGLKTQNFSKNVNFDFFLLQDILLARISENKITNQKTNK